MENRKKNFADKGFVGVVLKDLSKAFVTLNCEVLIAKLIAYCFTSKSLRLIESDLTDRWKRTKINKSFSK